MNMYTQQDMISNLVEALAKKAATPEEKMVQALLKAALLSDNLVRFIREVNVACGGLGKVKAQTVTDMVEYARAHNEARIRSTCDAAVVEAAVEQENNRLTEVEVWTLGALVYLGLLG